MVDVRGKFFPAEVTEYPGGEGGKVIFRAVSRGAVNASFSKATPSGTIEMHVSNPDAFAKFQDGVRRKVEYYVDFTEATPQAGDGHTFVVSPEGHYTHPRCAECGGEKASH